MRSLHLVARAVVIVAVTRNTLAESGNMLVNPSFTEPGDGPRSPARGWVANTTQFKRGDDVDDNPHHQGYMRFDGAAASSAKQCTQYIPGRRLDDNNPCWCSQVVSATRAGRRWVTIMFFVNLSSFLRAPCIVACVCMLRSRRVACLPVYLH